MQDPQYYPEQLRALMARGTTVYTILRACSQSGMRREISLCVIEPERHTPVCPDYAASQVLGWRMGKRDGLIIHGCGMDMGFRLVESLSQALYGEGNVLRHQWL